MLITWRVATTADLDRLAELNQQLIQDEGHRNPMTLAQLRERMADWLATSYQAILFEDAGQIAAYALYRHDPEWVYLRHFFVVRDLRRTGVGRMATELLLRDVFPPDRRIRLEVLIANQRAIAFWQSVGFATYALTLERTTAPSDHAATE